MDGGLADNVTWQQCCHAMNEMIFGNRINYYVCNHTHMSFAAFKNAYMILFGRDHGKIRERKMLRG